MKFRQVILFSRKSKNDSETHISLLFLYGGVKGFAGTALVVSLQYFEAFAESNPCLRSAKKGHKSMLLNRPCVILALSFWSSSSFSSEVISYSSVVGAMVNFIFDVCLYWRMAEKIYKVAHVLIKDHYCLRMVLYSRGRLEEDYFLHMLYGRPMLQWESQWWPGAQSPVRVLQLNDYIWGDLPLEWRQTNMTNGPCAHL